MNPMSTDSPNQPHYYEHGSEEGERVFNEKYEWFMAHGGPHHIAEEFALIETYGPVDDFVTVEEHQRLLAHHPPL